jgi:hypothetical protein
LISTLEWVRNLGLFREDGLLSWRILSLRPGLIFRGERAQSLFWDRSVLWVLGARTAAAVGLVAASGPLWQCATLLVLVATAWFLTKRTWLGEDGADQMGQLVSIGALLMAAGLALGQTALSFAGALLIAGQLAISYFFAGFSKLLSAEWRRGQAVVGVMGTHSYGHTLGARFAGGSAVLSIGFCWLVFGLETLFPLMLLLPHDLFLVALAVFFLFHLGTAYFMGLNTFVWAFAAAYPAAILLNELTTLAVWGQL